MAVHVTTTVAGRARRSARAGVRRDGAREILLPATINGVPVSLSAAAARAERRRPTRDGFEGQLVRGDLPSESVCSRVMPWPDVAKGCAPG